MHQDRTTTNGSPAGPMDIGARVRAARVQRGWSLRGLAGSIAVSAGTMSHIENGKTGLSVLRLQRIATALGATPEEVLATSVAGADTPHRLGSGAIRPSRKARSPEPRITDWRVYGPLELDSVLRAALAVFTTTGYHGATTRDVARECGRSVAGIYHHHPSKQEMLRQILDRGVAELLVRAEMAQAAGDDPVERFSFLVESLVLFHTHRRAVGFLGASEMRSLDPAARMEIAARRVRQQRMVDTEVLAAVAAGRFRTRQPREASRAVVTMCTSIAQWFQPGGELTPDAVAAQYVGFACDLMRFSPP